MSESVAIPFALDELDRRLRSLTDQSELIQVLRALQRLRLSETDLCVHIECLRATNDATTQDEDIEENCLLALDLVGGYTTGGLSWNAATMAPIFLGAMLDRAALDDGLAHAARPNDLLPRRPFDRLPQPVAAQLVDWVDGRLRDSSYSVEPADIYRAPKSAFTTRPAALLALPDRVALEALAEMISTRLDDQLPEEVVWPRSRKGSHTDLANADYRTLPLQWDSKYIVKADIANYYGSVDHALLGLITSTHLQMPRKYGQAVESLLTALMTIDRGLPQGVPASDLFASAFLLPIDVRLAELDAPYVRYADDYLLPASSMEEARSIVELLEEDLRGIGLALNDDKTRIMKSFTYRQRLEDHATAVADFVTALEQSHQEAFNRAQPNKWSERQVGATDEEGFAWHSIEDPLWDQMYLGDVTLDDVIEDLRHTIPPDAAQGHETLLRALVLELQSGRTVGSDAEDLGRRCLTCLAASRTVVDLDDVEALLQWFPKLAPHASTYLHSIACKSQNDVSTFLIRLLDRPERTDWASGWLCTAAQAEGFEVGGDLARRLEYAVRDRDEGMLTRTAAMRALAVAGRLAEGTWRTVAEDATPAVQSEIVFSALFEPDLYPWPAEGVSLRSPVKSLPN